MQHQPNRAATDRQLTARAAARRARYLRREVASGALPLTLVMAYLGEAERLERLFPDAVELAPDRPRRPRRRGPHIGATCERRHRRY